MKMLQRIKKYVVVTALVLGMGITPAILLEAVPARGKAPFIIDYQNHLNKRFKKIPRLSTRYIIIHTSEAGLASTLSTLSKGKSVGKYRTIGGHTNYTIARDGQVYRILHHNYRADHAGLSMWDGLEDISSHSLGIELVGYHYDTITSQQYSSLARLLKILQRLYNIPDKNILTHSQVSYGNPNTWFKRPHRGRKRCALNFEREKAGLKGAWTYDPDVKAGRLARDHHIYAMFYKKYKKPAEPEEVIAAAAPGKVTDKTAAADTTTTSPPAAAAPEKAPAVQNISNIISKDNTAWNIAGEDYDDASTLYVLPDQRSIRGDHVEDQIGWDRLPTGTRVLLNQPANLEMKKGPIFVVNKEYTAWSYAGANFSANTTFYFLPNGQMMQGNQVADWDSIPGGTHMIIGYNGPFSIQNRQGKTPWGIAGKAHNQPETIYLIPGQGVITGDKIKDFNDLPLGSKIFLKTN